MLLIQRQTTELSYMGYISDDVCYLSTTAVLALEPVSLWLMVSLLQFKFTSRSHKYHDDISVIGWNEYT